MATVSTRYKLLEAGEIWEEVDGEWQRTHSQFVFEDDGDIYRATSHMTMIDHNNLGDVPVSAITDKTLVPFESYTAPVKDWYTVAQPIRGHIKKPRLANLRLAYFTGEIETAEKLQEHPHANLMKYYGCVLERGRVAGLCFEKCDRTLMQVFNPGGYSKFCTPNGWAPEEIARWMDPIESAVRHLHSLGIAHNDINPRNIMFADRPVLIDLGSCAPFGKEHGGSTYEWYDEKKEVKHSAPKNDLDALQEIREWLSKKEEKVWLFPR